MAVVEGTTTLFPTTTTGASTVGPGARARDAAFYNPAMVVNRDLSVVLVDAWAGRRGRDVDVLDCLAGIGARSVRLAAECQAAVHVTSNDADPKAIKAGRRAASAAGADEAVRFVEGAAHVALAERRYDIVDVDPFGSPAPFLDAAVRATRHGGLLCVTATDTGALAGTYSKACIRRYGARPLHEAPWRAEAGLRILQAAVVRAAGRFDRAAAPVFSLSSGHWSRVVMEIRDGRKAADEAARTVAAIGVDAPTGLATQGEAGPVWWGPLHDGAWIRAMATAAPPHLHPDSVEALEAMRAEAGAPPGWFSPSYAAKHMGGQTPKRAALAQAFREGGHATWPCHIDGRAIRTDAQPDDAQAIWTALTA